MARGGPREAPDAPPLGAGLLPRSHIERQHRVCTDHGEPIPRASNARLPSRQHPTPWSGVEGDGVRREPRTRAPRCKGKSRNANELSSCVHPRTSKHCVNPKSRRPATRPGRPRGACWPFGHWLSPASVCGTLGSWLQTALVAALVASVVARVANPRTLRIQTARRAGNFRDSMPSRWRSS